MKVIYAHIVEHARKQKLFALLVDPDKHDRNSLSWIGQNADPEIVDFILVGGSLVSGSVDETVNILKRNTEIPIILFPGNVLQITPKADAILLLSLISGRNPEYLIGNHVIAAPILKKTDLEIIPTAYILIETGRSTSVEYMSNTRPIPADKTEITVATAMAGEMLGHKLVYLEAGSGALETVNENMITEVSNHIGIPLIVGGGIHSAEQIRNIYKAGANMIVVGTAIEKNPAVLLKLMASIKK